jgi:hypothetical protein
VQEDTGELSLGLLGSCVMLTCALLFNKYLSSIFYELGFVLDTGKKAMNETPYK